MEVSQKINTLLSQPGILVSDLHSVTKKIKSIHDGSVKKLQIVTDFDLTLTYYEYDGEKMWSSFGALENYHKHSHDFLKKLVHLRDQYAPVDADPSIEKEEKVRLIGEWNRRATEVYVSERITRDTIRDAVAVCKVKLRGGFKAFVECLSASDIPLLVLSAGMGDTIDLVMANNGICSEHLTVISNYLLFDSEGCIEDFTKPLITTGSKGNVAKMQAHFQYFESVSERSNVIVLGDRIEDVHVTSCFDGSCGTTLTIGFLNDKVEAQKELYLKNYNIVLVGDPDLSWVQMLLDVII